MTSLYWDKSFERHKASDLDESSEFAHKAMDYIKKHNFKKILEIGPGIGKDTKLFYKKGLDLTTIDISKAALDNVKIIAPTAKVVLKDTKNMNFPANSFDCVYARLSLQYWDNKVTSDIFSKIHNVLIDGGILFASCKSEKDKEYGIGEMIEQDMFYNPKSHTRHFFTLGYFKEKAKSFKIIELNESNEKESSFSNLIAEK